MVNTALLGLAYPIELDSLRRYNGYRRSLRIGYQPLMGFRYWGITVLHGRRDLSGLYPTSNGIIGIAILVSWIDRVLLGLRNHRLDPRR